MKKFALSAWAALTTVARISMVLAAASSSVAYAQEEEPESDVDAALEKDMSSAERKSAEARAGAKSEDLPEIGEDRLQVFKLERGFYFSADLGNLQSFGGTQGMSNLQPYFTLKAGFDINDYLGVELYLGSGYVSGNPVSANDLPGAGGAETANYGLLLVGAEAVAAVRPTERFALEPKLGLGLTRINPVITDPSNVGVTLSPTAPHAAFGLDFKYLTLLTDFTAGLSLTGYFVIGPNVFTLAEALVVRYTF